jgi:hypothetical protein
MPRKNQEKQTADLSTTLPRASCFDPVALMKFVRLSLRRAASVVMVSAARQESGYTPVEMTNLRQK